jgi:hypothetical protein
MPAIARAFIFLAIGAGLQAIIGFAILPWLLGGVSTGTIVLALIGTIGAAIYGFITGFKEIYAIDKAWAPRSIFLFVIDITWSALNTLTGLGFLIYCAAKGSFTTPDEKTQKSGMIHFTGAALPGAGATTIGNVMGGSWMTHELIHAQQARIFGPFYWPAYLFTYAFNMLARIITGRIGAKWGSLHWEAYERVPMEDWAYRSAPGNDIQWGAWTGWFFLTLINVLSIMILLVPIPVAGAIPAMIGFGFLPWWVGLIVLFLFAFVRSFLAKGRDAITGFEFK